MIDLRSNIDQVLGFWDRFDGNYRFAIAAAMTDAVKAGQQAMPAELERDLDDPTTFTKRGFYIERAEKDRLVAVLGVKVKQAEYLRYQVMGGDRYPRRRALKLPSAALAAGDAQTLIKLDAHGNIKRTDLRRLIVLAKDARVVNRKYGRTKTSDMGKSEGILYGQPANRPGMPPGIYQRMRSGSWQNAGTQRRWLLPLVLFPQGPARYEPRRFDFHKAARREVLKAFAPALRRRWQQALATSRR